VRTRPLHAVLVPHTAGPRFLELLAAALDGTGPALLPLDPDLPAAALRELLITFAPSSVTDLRAGTTHAATLAQPSESAAASAPGVQPEVAVVIATSGSTGMPKGVELTAAALLASAAASLHRIGGRPGERWLCCLPVHHVAGIGVLVRSLLAGAEPVFAQPVSPELLAGSGCQHVSLVPTQLRRLLADGMTRGGLRTVLLGGAAAAAGLLAEAAAAGLRVVSTYGMTETCGGCVYDGLALDGVDVAIGADGRISLSGPTLFTGYRLEPELTGAALNGGWFRTADYGEFAHGRLVVRGRADDVIVSGGEKVLPGEVEAALGTCLGVADVVVVGVPDPDWGEAVTAFVIPADPAMPPGLEELKAGVRQVLPAYAAPRRMWLVSQFPQLPSGKPDRVALREVGGKRAAQDGVS
jgi:o-succinylbenzoate---CoA ligase